jgi:hypothetical protein
MRNIAFATALLFTFSVYAQVTGGRAMFEFLNVPANAELAAWGGQNVSVKSKDPAMFLANPALLNDQMHKVASVSYLPYVANVKMYSLAVAAEVGKLGPFAVGFKYLDYGTLDERSEDATFLRTFRSSDYAFTLGKSYTIGTITLGANAKFLGSELASYRARAWAVDAGALFTHPEHPFTIGLAVKNLGRVYKSYTSTSSDSLPFNVQMGISYKFEHAPLRLSLTAHTLNRWDVAYNDPNFSNKVDNNGKSIPKTINNWERLFRHMILAMEVTPVKFLRFQLGYNYMMSRELSLTDAISSAGLSLGGAVRWDRFQASYAHTIVHRAGGMNIFTLNVDMGTGFKSEKQQK